MLCSAAPCTGRRRGRAPDRAAPGRHDGPRRGRRGPAVGQLAELRQGGGGRRAHDLGGSGRVQRPEKREFRLHVRRGDEVPLAVSGTHALRVGGMHPVDGGQAPVRELGQLGVPPLLGLGDVAQAGDVVGLDADGLLHRCVQIRGGVHASQRRPGPGEPAVGDGVQQASMICWPGLSYSWP